MNLKKKIGIGVLSILLPFITVHEGRRYTAYLDPIGIPTICEGTTKGVRLGDKATPEQCDEYTIRDLNEAYQIFIKWVPEEVVDKLPPETLAAFLSFIYNVGPGGKGVKDGFVYLKSGRHSTMLRNLQSGNVVGACNQLPFWTSAGGKVYAGLVKRRAEEKELCLRNIRYLEFSQLSPQQLYTISWNLPLNETK